jgi:endonuclease G
MVPAADAKSSQEAMNETFVLSNIAPQVGEGFNRDYWAHMEDFTRRLVTSFSDLYVFTVPLYLPRQSADGKWRVSYEVIGDPPNVSVPTHFAKVIYAKGRPSPTSSSSAPITSRGGGGGLLGLGTGLSALGAFVVPNAVIPNDVPLRSFVVPVESVERAAGISLFPMALKSASRPLCDVVDCQIIVRDFSNNSNNSKANKQQQQQAKAAPGARAGLPINIPK